MAKKKKSKKEEPVEETKEPKKGKKAKKGWKEQLAEEEEAAKKKKQAEEDFLNRPTKFVVARHILMSDKDKAQEVYDEIFEEHKDNPTSAAFGKFAKAHSECDSSTKGGKLGAFGRGKMAEEFEEAAFNTEPGKMTTIVHTEFGYHIILVEEHKK
ncbi:unnamed protein product [Moneuplotes crassus]|uniref:Peptidyl-prolyl cis-trans isomerase n=1 Tax=Euplotes crassus TaxID=5936 RepID=A0A7S3NRR8_EUPCR|nr:unnamed protein product [Moneuplotes crassus]|mmetsp:Transcript_25098/g.24848  ORF Transcript_25098/g.24848 Transcript_25098/m.24848 type:complete len:155 (+) Transcript_25098:1-465(+)